MSLTADIQKLDPGNELVLIEIDGTDFGADVLRFQSHLQGYTEEEIRSAISSGDELPLSKIVWQGRDYFTWPASISGLESNSDGSPASPSLSVANVDSSITALCLAYQDMSQAKVTIHRTLKNIWIRITSPVVMMMPILIRKVLSFGTLAENLRKTRIRLHLS